MTTTKLEILTVEHIKSFIAADALVVRSEITCHTGEPWIESYVYFGHFGEGSSRPLQWIGASFRERSETIHVEAWPIWEPDQTFPYIVSEWIAHPGWARAEPMVTTYIPSAGTIPESRSSTCPLMMQHWRAFRAALAVGKCRLGNNRSLATLAQTRLGSRLDTHNRQVGLETLLKD